MLEHGPERDRVETLPAKVLLQKRSANHRNTATLRVIQGRTGDVRAQDKVILRPSALEFVKKRARRTTDIQHRARPAITAQQSQFPREPDRSVVTLEFVCRQVKGRGLVTVEGSMNELRFDRIG